MPSRLELEVLNIDSTLVLDKLIYLTDQKIDVLEHLIEKLNLAQKEEQRRYIKSSPYADRLDLLNMEFVSQYEYLLKIEGVNSIANVRKDNKEKLLLLKTLVEYAYEMDAELDGILKGL